MTFELIKTLESQLLSLKEAAEYLIGHELGSDALLERWLMHIIDDPYAYDFASKSAANLIGSFLAYILMTPESLEARDINTRMEFVLRKFALGADVDVAVIRRSILPARETLKKLFD
jgi:hypothetical protein